MSFAQSNSSRASGTAAAAASTSYQMANSIVKKEPIDLNTTQAFCLRWNNYQSNMVNVFDQIFHDEKYVDVTLVCEGTFIKAHKIVLSACSPYFQQIFDTVASPHPVIVLKDMLLSELKPILDFMYKGEIYVAKEQIGVLLRVAESLKVRGLAEVAEENVGANIETDLQEDPLPVAPTIPTTNTNLRHSSKRKMHSSSSESLFMCDTNDDIAQAPAKQIRHRTREQSLIIPDDDVTETDFDATTATENHYEDEVYPVDLDDYRDDSMSETSGAEKVSSNRLYILKCSHINGLKGRDAHVHKECTEYIVHANLYFSATDMCLRFILDVIISNS